MRHKAYLSTMHTLVNLKIHYGKFLRHQVVMPDVNLPLSTVEVIKTEEKGSDVNFLVYLLNDAWKNRYDCAVWIRNDSDIAEAMRIVKKGFYKKKQNLMKPRRRLTVGLKNMQMLPKPLAMGI